MAAPVTRIAVLLATYNGADNLREQLDSFAAQTLRPTWLVVSDDGSRDATLDLVADFAARSGIEVRVLRGPQAGAALNFLHLLRNIPEGADAIALSDQDDVWLADKLERGARALGDDLTLYAATTWVCAADLSGRRLSRCPTCPPGFRHALVQNIAGGNTMMLNRAGIALLQRAAVGVGRLVVHDWWIYQVVTGAGGRVVFDKEPVLLYRQHGGNEIGANDGLRSKIRRMGMLVSGTFRDWNAVNLAALDRAAPILTDDARKVLTQFAELRRAGLATRLRLLRRAGLYRQDITGNLSLWVAAVLGRL